MKMARVSYFTSARQFSVRVREIVTGEFGFGCSSELIDVLFDSVPTEPDSVFRMPQMKILEAQFDLVIVLVPQRLVTPFGYAVAGECRGNIIVLSTEALTMDLLPRLLRHEIGHSLGIEEHLDCVMSRYQVRDASYCPHCIQILHSQGIDWAPLYVQALPPGSEAKVHGSNGHSE